jgi:hypothetical protein
MSRTKCKKILLFSKIFRKINMDIKGWSLTELSEKLEIPENTVQQRLHRAGIEPVFRGSLYPPDTLDRIREAPMGRPPKARPEAPDRAANKSKK